MVYKAQDNFARHKNKTHNPQWTLKLFGKLFGVYLKFHIYGLRVLVYCLSCWNASMTKLSFGYFDEWE